MPTDGKVIRTQRNSSHKANDYPERSGRHVVLPDVTGLTNAVESPMKGDGRRLIFPAGERPKDSEGDCVPMSLNHVDLDSQPVFCQH
jgi:hypothetical protein